MKVCIYGAGAIGGWIGVRLARAGSPTFKEIDFSMKAQTFQDLGAIYMNSGETPQQRREIERRADRPDVEHLQRNQGLIALGAGPGPRVPALAPEDVCGRREGLAVDGFVAAVRRRASPTAKRECRCARRTSRAGLAGRSGGSRRRQ